MTRPLEPPSRRTRIRVRTDALSPWPAQAMLALLDRDPHTPAKGDRLPLGWHWLHFHEPERASDLGADGHERRGGFMPDVDLPRRMWAGGTLREIRQVTLGERATLESRVLRVTEKMGRSGRLVFVDLGHAVLQGGRLCVEEEQTIVYRDAARRLAVPSVGKPQTGAAMPTTPADTFAWSETFVPTPVTLFHFSALTYNGHRIHYDHPYATQHEGYKGLIVHGPLIALLLLDAVRRHSGPVSRFRYRALAPLFADEPITLAGRPSAGSSSRAERIVEAVGPSGSVAMRAWAG